MKLALLGAKIGPNLFVVIPPDWPPSSCVSGTPKALSHPATRGESHAAPKPVPTPRASVAEDFPRKLVAMIKISVCYELPSPWKLVRDVLSLIYAPSYMWIQRAFFPKWVFLHVFWKLMDKEQTLQYYKSLRGQCWALCCQHFKPDQQNPAQRKFLCRWNIMSTIYHYQKDGPFSKIFFFALFFWSGLNCGPLYAWHDLHGFQWYCPICPVNLQVMCKKVLSIAVLIVEYQMSLYW